MKNWFVEHIFKNIPVRAIPVMDFYESHGLHYETYELCGRCYGKVRTNAKRCDNCGQKLKGAKRI